ncbi:MAG TPA: indolepyruvate oxidoreductase subunit beta family protein [Rhizomicrobium sp.]|nr:indolepyruvate oxidoreductase subunit beta family protein [Rhizomicrobium sp.]
MERRRITVAVLALGGQGGGVFADWLTALAEANGYFAQATSVPGVAQRTGSTVYYLELFPAENLRGRQPVLALMPAPSDVDVVVTSELMEAGRAMLRGFVTCERTALITSTHRIYAISEKSALSGGLADSSKVLDAAVKNAKSLVAFDMDDLAKRTGSAISAVMLGAVAGSGVLPFIRAQYEEAIRKGGIAVDANLAGFAAGFDASTHDAGPETQVVTAVPAPVTEDGKRLRDRVLAEMPILAQAFALEGVRRLIEYQDVQYATLYLDRLRPLSGDTLVREMSCALARWMAYEDMMRVAQLKIQASRVRKVRAEINAGSDQIILVTEYMHPRWQEFCDVLPAGLGAQLAGGGLLKRLLAPMFKKGRHVRTTNVGWFLVLRILAAHRYARRGTLRYKTENARIEAWLAEVANTPDPEAALELAKCQNLIKGYGDTHERGLRKFTAIMEAYRHLRGKPNAAPLLRALREAAFRDEEGLSLDAELSRSSA